MTSVPAQVHPALAHYARRFHATCGTGHHVASPLGCWLLLALCAPASSGRAREELTEALGVDPDTAAGVAAALLEHPHELVGSAAAVWNGPAAGGPALSGWLATLPAAVATGDLPDQAGLDTWASGHTMGLIDRFPLRVRPETLLMLATALATRVSWVSPFEPAPAAALGAGSAWAGRVDRVLRTPKGHDQYVAVTDEAGDVAVHTALAEPRVAGGEQHGLRVTSVIAAADVPAADVLAAAHRLAGDTASGARVPRRSLFDLPLGESPLWTVEERPAVTKAPSGREERCTAVLPAWSARSDIDLDQAELGTPAAARALAGVLGLSGYRYQARQAAVARYSRYGFEAAALSAMAVAMSLPLQREGLLRTAELRFGHPFAVVAVATQRVLGDRGASATGPWDGLPVFSAWVTEVEDADDEPGGHPAGNDAGGTP